MERTWHLSIGVAATAILLTSCSAGPSGSDTPEIAPAGIASSAEFNTYWHQGKAELGHYALTQARYGELRNGDAVLVFVTEDVLDSAQVKYEGIGDASHTSVLKLNRIDRFVTGIYDYSLMTSTFSPVDGTPPMKVSCTTQDWCGQMFMQLNRQANGYRYELRSYFQADGDKNGTIDHAALEDDIMNQIRIDPAKLPTGTVDMLPTLSYLRLMHKPVQAVKVDAVLAAQGDTSTYRMQFSSLDRTVSIHFGTVFPHVIFGWEETPPDGVGDNAHTLTTTARLKKQVMEPYWAQHAVADSTYRRALGLPE
ncbi:MAG: septum formation inhibitor Maf [Flavobacteriales bacterium]|nr:septum formation inhibitor Maf [Flavobacteriales bacterium]